MIENKALKERIADCNSRVDSAHWAINSNRESDVIPTTAFRSLALDCLEIAGCELHLGNTNSARQWFARAAYAERSYVDVFARHYDELPVSNQNNGSTRAHFAIQDALLAGDRRLIDALANQVLALSDDYPNEYLGTGETYYKACFLASLATDDMESAAQYRDRCKDVIDDPDAYVAALLRAYDGLLDDDATAVESGLQEMLDIHADEADDLSRWLQVMSPAAGALFLLARDNDMDITVDSWYLPDGLGTYAIGGQIDLPRPEYLREEMVVAEA